MSHARQHQRHGSGSAGRRIVLVGVLLAMLTGVVPATLLPTAAAAPVAPAELSADLTPTGAPVLRWGRVPGATSYQVEISGTDAFTTTVEGTVTTTNVQYVAAKALPESVHWRVRSRDAAGASAWTTAWFERSTGAPPSLLSPADGSPITSPEQVPVLHWSPVRGASAYTVRVGQDSGFTDPSRYTEVVVRSTSYVVNPTRADSWWWQVQAQFAAGINGPASEVRSFTTLGLPPIDTASATPQHSSADQYVEDAVFDWDPVPGAVSYEIQIDTDDDFNPSQIEKTGILATTYSHDLSNDQYYWRVRAVDAYGVKQPWSASLMTVRRAWPRQPSLEWPVDQAVGADPLTGPVYYQWTPVRLASSYRIQVASDASFQNIVGQCVTVHTTYVPDHRSDCWPAPGAVRYWRVQAYDGRESSPEVASSDLISAEVHRFVYDVWSTTPVAPQSGSTGAAPTLRWAPVAGASKYLVQVVNASTGVLVESATTRGTAYTPRKNLLADTDSPTTYRWNVVPQSEQGSGNGWSTGSQPLFTVTETGGGSATSPEPAGPTNASAHRTFPTLSWDALPVPVTVDGVTSPAKYRVYVRPAGTITWPATPTGETAQPRFEDISSTFLSPGDYEWRVEATLAGEIVGSTSTRTFTIESLPAVTGQRVALRGTSLWTAAALSSERCDLQWCARLPQTPLLTWDAEVSTGLYRVVISRDAELTNIVSTTLVEQNALLVRTALPDSQAGAPYYWTVQSCVSPTLCRAASHATYSFEKRSNQVTPLSPTGSSGSPAIVTDDVTLRWQDYLLTNRDDDSDDTDVSTTARLEARSYRVQVAADAAFTSMIDTAVVQQSEFTSPTKTYPEGPLYWRVQAVDGSGNSLPWSATQNLEKRSAAPTPTAPVAGAVTTRPELAWDVLPFAASYDLEVYRNSDTNAGSANKVVGASTRNVAYTHSDPLPVTTEPYVWRVRRKDAGGRTGAWSAWASFRVAGVAPQYVAPANASSVEPNGALFTWTMPDDAAVEPSSYRFEWRRPGATSTISKATTVAPAYAPVATLADGTWEWRVVALDAKGAELGASRAVDEQWRSMTVSGAPVATGKPQIEGVAAVDSLLHALPATWDLTGVTETWQWLRSGTPISGATGDTYRVTALDVGKPISVRVTGQKDGYAHGTATSDAVTAGTGPAAERTSDPTVTGTGMVGTVLTVTPGVWSPTATETYQWLRGGTTIGGQTSASYKVVPADVGQDVTVRITAKAAGRVDATYTSPAVRGTAGTAPHAVTLPSVSGTPSPGATLTATTGAWQDGTNKAVSPAFGYQWLRNGVPITGATGRTYTASNLDAARSLTVMVTARVAGLDEGRATSPAVTVGRAASRTTVRPSSTIVSRGATVTVRITVSAPGLTPTGTVTLYDKVGSGPRFRLRTVTLSSTARGTVAVKVRLTRPGSNVLTATYGGDSRIRGSASTGVRVTVR